jgi:hypothetical protein
MMIDDVKYIRADRVSKDIGPKRIVVADRGWVFVGDCEDHAGRNGYDSQRPQHPSVGND